MSWIAIGDWAEEMHAKMEQQRRERLKHAAQHFGLDLLNILGDAELEANLLARYETTGLPWPTFDDDEDD
jgi:hypothetical protein